LSICKASGGNEWHLERLSSSTEEDEIRNIRLADVPSTLEAIDAQEINTKLDGTLCVTNGGTLVEYNCANSFQLFDNWSGAVPGGLDNSDTFVDSHLCICSIIRCIHGWKKCNIDTKRLIGHGLAFSDFLSKVFWGRLCESSEDAQTTRV